MTVPPPEELQRLLQHEAFLRALARHLLHDEHEAEDAVQDAWLVFLSSSRDAPRAPQSWLGRVVWNIAADARRRRLRRTAREADAVREETLPSPAESLERRWAGQQLVGAVLALDEIYRAAIVLRFYHELSMQEVAARLGVPLETARTRIRRGLGLLRERLERDFPGEGRKCHALLALLAREEVGIAPPRAPERASPSGGSVPGFLRSTAARWLSGSAALSLALIGYVWFEAQAAGEEPVGLELARRAERDRASVRVDGPSTRRSAPIAPRRSRPSEAALEPASVAAGGSLSGRTLDAAGNPVAGAEVRVWDDWPPRGEPVLRTTSDASGAFEVAGVPATITLEARTSPLSVSELVLGDVAGRSIRGLELVLEELRPIRGHVVDELGAGVAGVQVRIEGIDGEGAFRASAERGLFTAALVDSTTLSAADGRFELHARAGNYYAFAFEPSFAPAGAVVRAGGDEVEVTLARGFPVEVQVLDPNGYGVPGARVSLCSTLPVRPLGTRPGWDGVLSATSDAAGLCALAQRQPSDLWFMLRADAPGWGSVFVGPVEIGPQDGAQRLVLTRPRALGGRVVSRGEPVGGARVAASFAVDEARAYALGFNPLETFRFLHETTTTVDGRFVLDGLPEGALDLWVLPPEGALAPRSVLLAAGASDVEIDLDSPSQASVFQGCVFDGSTSAPLERFTLTVLPDGAGRTVGMSRRFDEACYSFAVFEQRPYALVFQSPGYATSYHVRVATAPGVIPLDVELFPERDVSVRVVDEAGRPVPRAWLRVTDTRGEPLAVSATPTETQSLQRCGNDGMAHLVGLPATRVRVLVGAHARAEFEAFELDLAALPERSVQELQIRAVDLDDPPRRFDLELCSSESGPPRWQWTDTALAAPAFAGHVTLALEDGAGRRWWTLRGECTGAGFQPDPDPAWLNLRLGNAGEPVDSWRATARPHGFDMDGGAASLARLERLPGPDGSFSLELVPAAGEGFRIEVTPDPDPRNGRLSISVPAGGGGR